MGVIAVEQWKESLAEIVHKARDGLGLTQDQIAEMAGVDYRTVYNIEHCKTNPSMRVLYPLIRILSIDPKDVFYPEKAQESPACKQLRQMIEGCSEKEAIALLHVNRGILEAMRSPDQIPVK